MAGYECTIKFLRDQDNVNERRLLGLELVKSIAL